jgi:DNA repair exonuclease SbcCD nuclease subunit
MRMMQYVRDRGVNVVLISGDLFDNRYATNTTAEILIREFRNCSETVFIISPGRSDYYENNPIYASGRLPSNVYVFSKDVLSRFDFEQFNVTVYGWAFMGETMTESPLYEKTVDDASRINLVCGYGDLNGSIDSDQCPLSENELKKFGADYYALGSRHEAGDFMKIGDSSIYSYCGSLECTGFEDTGIGGANLIVVDYKNGELSIDVKKLSFGRLHFVTETIDITGVDTGSEIINRITKVISEKKYGMETALRVELTGEISPHFLVPKGMEYDAFGLYYFDLVDKTMPLYGTEHFARDMNAAGEVYRKLLPLLTSEDEEERLTAAKAFRVALAALENREAEI